MSVSLIQQDCMNYERLCGPKSSFFNENHDSKLKEIASTNFVPAVAVKRRMRVLLSMTGRKEYVSCFSNFIINIKVVLIK